MGQSGQRVRSLSEFVGEYGISVSLKDLEGHEDNVGEKFLVPLLKSLGYEDPDDIDRKPQFRHAIVGESRREPDLGVLPYDESARGAPLYGIVADQKPLGASLTTDMEEKVAGYCVLAGARYGVLTNGAETIFLEPQRGAAAWSYVDRLPRKDQLREELEETAVEYDATSVIYAKRAVHELTEDTIEDIAEKCHNIIRSRKGMAVPERLYEFSKLIVARIIDERRYREGAQEDLLLTSENVEEMERRRQPITAYVSGILDSIRDDAGVFEKGESVNLDDDILKEIIGHLDDYPLWSENVDVLGHVYEKFLMNTMTGKELGGYFTPRPVVDALVEMVEPSLDDRIIDPACGSGGFLISPLMYLKQRFGLDDAQVEEVAQNFEGVDIFPVICRLCQINLWLHGDCHENVYRADSLRLSGDTPPSIRAALQDPAEDGFDIVLTNPPYGAREGNEIPADRMAEYSDTWRSEGIELFESAFSRSGEPISLQPQMPFMELCMKLLRVPGDGRKAGRLGIVVDNGVLSNTVEEAQVIRRLIQRYCVIEAIIGLPKGTFKPYGSNVIPVFMLLRRRSTSETGAAPIFRAEPTKVGLQPGRTVYKKDSAEDLNRVVELWKTWTPDPSEPLSVFDIDLPVWDTLGWDYRIDNNYFSPAALRVGNRLESLTDRYDIVPLESVTDEILSGTSPASDGDIPLLQGGNIKPNCIDPSIKKYTKENQRRPDPYVSVGDIIVVKDGTPGHVATVTRPLMEHFGRLMVSYHLYLIRVSDEHKDHSAFITAFLNSRMGQALVRKLIGGSVTPTIRDEEIRNLRVPIPHNSEESSRIQRELEALQESLLRSEQFIGPSTGIDASMIGDETLPALPHNWVGGGRSTKHNYADEREVSYGELVEDARRVAEEIEPGD